MKSLSRVQLFETPWTIAYQALRSMGLSRQECWSGLPFPSPGDLPDPGIEPATAQTVKHLPTMWETRVQSLGWEDLLGKGMATHSSILAWKIPWMEEPGGLQSKGSQRAGHD